jgi:hypothetical protein
VDPRVTDWETEENASELVAARERLRGLLSSRL